MTDILVCPALNVFKRLRTGKNACPTIKIVYLNFLRGHHFPVFKKDLTKSMD